MADKKWMTTNFSMPVAIELKKGQLIILN